jgi:pimeloyl-ACP methyl ester carboxylesterase
MLATAATRIDVKARIRDEAEFSGPDHAGLYTCLHVPLGRAVGGVVMCSSIHAELQENYRSEVLLARAFAARGLGVMRFHYRGFGHSAGSGELATFDSLRADALAAKERLTAKTGVTRFGFIGVRLGGLVAAAAARDFAGAPVVLWEPTSDPKRYFRDAIRARNVHRLRTQAPGRPATSLVKELHLAGVLDVLGYPIHSALYDSTTGRGLADELGLYSREVLLVTQGGAAELSSEHARLVETLRRNRLQVEVRSMAEQQAWWFARGVGQTSAALERAMGEWLVSRLVGDRT